MGVYNTIDTNDTMSMTQTILIVILVILLIVLHIGQAIFLNLFNKKVNKKNAWISWIPIICLYFLGELTFNSTIAGYILIAIPIIFYFIDNLIIGIMIIIGIYVYAIIKYIALNKEEKEALTPKMTTTSVSEKNPFEIKKPKLAKFEKPKEEPKKEETEEPQQYQSQQPMNANSFKENNNGFDNRGGLGSSSNSSSLQDLYRK